MVKKTEWKHGVMTGKKLEDAIEKMRITPNAFAKLCIRENGKPLSQSTIVNLIKMPGIVPDSDTIKAVERALKQTCSHCGQYLPKHTR